MKNKTIISVAKKMLKELLSECTEGQQQLFKKMYCQNLQMSINEAVDQMSDDKIDWAMTQVERTVEKNRSVVKKPTSEPTKPAVEEAQKMMSVPMNQLPTLAIEFLNHLSKRVGFCGEVCLSAYAAYNQFVLKMVCEDTLYKVTDSDSIKWWNERGFSI